MNERINDFLTRHSLSESSLDIKGLCNYFLSEMKAGLAKKPSSLPMINSYCNPVSRVPAGEKVIVIDAGGTNLRTCLISFDEKGNSIIEDFRKSQMPGIGYEISASDFFKVFADETERLITKSDRIGFCFSYAAEILPDHDGVPLVLSKEINAPEVVGKKLGKELFAEFSRRGYDVSKKKIIILNDTVATLLAGISKMNEFGCDGCIGFILGTGTNTAYIEKGSIINEESGGLNLTLGDIDEKFLASTLDPHSYRFEKMISGKYLGPGCLFVLREAQAEGLISSKTVLPENLHSSDISAFLTGEESNLKIENSEDSETALVLIKAYISRTAKLVAANLAASILKTEYGKDKPVLINADGSTFYFVPGLKEQTESYLATFLNNYDRSAVFTQIENSPALGSAIGALSI
ncbi:MAG: hexokinase [Sphaerochaetaceae bacterium]|nr:hexokinase [Sphaerochaetaceae bacterium]